ncbi:MAG TPA: phosphatidate cytidylyltransferase [Planctomycetota bacterium]|nr:phosphatidate cytidylyltransferase [Planctomycetota bacterium]
MNRVLIRVIGAPLLLAGVALAAYADFSRKTTTAVTVLIGCFAAISFHELCAMARKKGLRPAVIPGLAAIIVNFAGLLGMTGPGPGFVTVTLVLLIFVLLKQVFCSRDFTPIDAGYTILAYEYVSLLLFIPFNAEAQSWMYWLLFLVATNKGSDMAAYVVGKTIGRHKLAPAVSPNKTWEGAIGGLVVGTVLGVVVLRTWQASVAGTHFSADLGFLAAVSAGVTVAAQLGDLVKSAIKRWAGVKDSGRLLPEFGGALDMVDSFILSAPVAAWLVLGRF